MVLIVDLGLSWTTNEHGLTIDTLVSCEVVLPNGTVTIASADSNPDLFFGLKVCQAVIASSLSLSHITRVGRAQ